MAPSALDRIEDIQSKVQHVPRVTLTELARGKGWRKELPECGLMELVDRGETSGWLISDEYMGELLQSLRELAEGEERREIQAMMDARAEYQDWLGGQALAEKAAASLKARKEAMKAAFDER